MPTSGSLVDLDPPPAGERRWPFYVGWALGGIVVGAVLVSQLPASLRSAGAVAKPIVTTAPEPTAVPATPRLAPVRLAPVPDAPARR